MNMFIVYGLVIWLVTVVPVYRLLRRWIVRDSSSDARRFVFALVCGTIVAPGLIALGHPPLLPFPGAALLAPPFLIRGGQDGYVLGVANLASWLSVTTCIMIAEGMKPNRTHISKPSRVVNAVRIMWMLLIALFMRIISVAIQASVDFTANELIQTLGILVLIILLALLTRAVSSGRNWARFVYAVIAVSVILLGSYTLFSATEFDLTLGLIRVIIVAALLLVLYLLFHPTSNEWFSERSPDGM